MPLVKDSKPLVAVCGSDATKARDLAWELGKVGFPGAVVVDHEHLGLPKAGARQPDQAGVDRRVQALAAATLAAGPAIVVCAGTALTVDLAGADGALLGGTIGIGLGLAARALTIGAEKLPLVDLKGATPGPGHRHRERHPLRRRARHRGGGRAARRGAARRPRDARSS